MLRQVLVLGDPLLHPLGSREPCEGDRSPLVRAKVE